MQEKLKLIATLFNEPLSEKVAETGDNVPLQHGNYYGGIYNKRKYLYSQIMIETLSLEKLEQIIKKQTGIV